MASIQHLNMPEDGLHESKGVSTAAANKVYVTDGAGSGTFNDYPLASSEVVVRTVADFPAAVGGVITLAASTRYLLDGHIDLGSDRIVLSANTIIHGLDTELASITSTTTGNLFTATASFHFDNFKATATSGTIFSCTGSATESAWINNFTISSCSTVGTFTTWYSLYWDGGAVVTSTSPLSFVGACGICILNLVEWVTGYTTGVDFGTATFNKLTLWRCGFGYASATNHVIVAASSANLNAGKEGRFTACDFDAGATNIVTNYDVGDLQWEVRHCLNLENSTKNAQGYMHTSNTTTIGAGSGDDTNPIILDCGTDWVNHHSDQFTISTAGRFTYDGINDSEFLVNVSLAGDIATGNISVSHYIAKNGVAQTPSRTRKTYTSSYVTSPALCSEVIRLSTNDYIEVFVENHDSTANWVTDFVNVTITELP